MKWSSVCKILFDVTSKTLFKGKAKLERGTRFAHAIGNVLLHFFFGPIFRKLNRMLYSIITEFAQDAALPKSAAFQSADESRSTPALDGNGISFKTSSEDLSRYRRTIPFSLCIEGYILIVFVTGSLRRRLSCIDKL